MVTGLNHMTRPEKLFSTITGETYSKGGEKTRQGAMHIAQRIRAFPKKHTQKSTLEPLLLCNEFVGKASIGDTKSITVRNDSHFLNAQGKKSILMQLLSFWPPRSFDLLKNEN